MNPFEEMLTSEIRLIKPSGDVLGPFKAFVQDSEIYFFEVHHPVSTGDKIVRELPNGMKETYFYHIVRGLFAVQNIGRHAQGEPGDVMLFLSVALERDVQVHRAVRE